MLLLNKSYGDLLSVGESNTQLSNYEAVALSLNWDRTSGIFAANA